MRLNADQAIGAEKDLIVKVKNFYIPSPRRLAQGRRLTDLLGPGSNTSESRVEGSSKSMADGYRDSQGQD